MDSFRDEIEEDPIMALRRIRDENAEKFPTVKELLDYMDTVPSAKTLIAELDREITKKKLEEKPV